MRGMKWVSYRRHDECSAEETLEPGTFYSKGEDLEVFCRWLPLAVCGRFIAVATTVAWVVDKSPQSGLYFVLHA